MIHIQGSFLLHAPRESVWPRIFDPVELMSLIPGCQNLTQANFNEYRGQIQVGLAAVRGVYETFVQVLQQDPPEACQFQGEVSGSGGTITGEAKFLLLEVEQNTQIDYQAKALITGSLAKLSPRFVEGVVQTLIKMGLANLDRQMRKT